MPLSDRERRILDDIEAQLRLEDPRFARVVATTTVASAARRQVRRAAVGLALGFVLLLGLVAHFGFGVAGFALMLVSAVYGGDGLRRLARERAAANEQDTAASPGQEPEGR